MDSKLDDSIIKCQVKCQGLQLCTFWTLQQHIPNKKSTCVLYNFTYEVNLEEKFLHIPTPKDVLKCVSGPKFCCKYEFCL